MRFKTIPFLSSVTPTGGGGTTFIRFTTLDSMTESGDGTTGWIYTAGDGGNASAADYTLASGVAGGGAVQMDANGAWPLFQFRTADAGDWSTDYHLMAYADGTDWYCATAGLTSVVTVPRTYSAGDWTRITFDATDGFVVEIARTATPTTWLELAVGTLTRSSTLYPRVNGIFGAGSVFTAPRVAP